MSENENLETSLELGYGARLRAEREAREIGVDEVCRQLNLHRKVVESLEAEDQSNLPSPAFVRGYLRSYARMLGLDGDALVKDYNSRGTEDPIPGSMTSIGEQPRSDHPVMRWATIVIIVLIVALLGAWLLTRGSGLSDMLGSEDDTASNSVVIAPQPSSDTAVATESDSMTSGITAPKPLVISASEPEVEEGAAAAEAETTAASESEAGTAEPVDPEPTQEDGNEESVASPEAATPEAEGGEAEAVEIEVAEVTPSQPVVESKDDEEAAVVPEPTSAVEDAAVAAPEPEATSADSAADQRLLSSGEDVLELSAAEDSWVEISDAIGNRLMFDMLRGGESRSLRGTAPFRVFLGNAPPVSMTVNGSSVDRPRVSSRNTARFVVEADGTQHR